MARVIIQNKARNSEWYGVMRMSIRNIVSALGIKSNKRRYKSIVNQNYYMGLYTSFTGAEKQVDILCI